MLTAYVRRVILYSIATQRRKKGIPSRLTVWRCKWNASRLEELLILSITTLEMESCVHTSVSQTLNRIFTSPLNKTALVSFIPGVARWHHMYTLYAYMTQSFESSAPSSTYSSCLEPISSRKMCIPSRLTSK